MVKYNIETDRLGIISDIHANLPALDAVLAEGKRAGVRNWLFLGDLVGYYYWPLECYNRLKELNILVIAGNHDRMAIRAQKDKDFLISTDAKYGSGLRVVLDQMNSNILNYIAKLPDKLELQVNNKSVLMCHGSPWDADQYIYPDAGRCDRERMAEGKEDYIFFGHTHYPVSWTVASSTIINPGSVGQPRNRVPGAHWVLWDIISDQFIFRQESYNTSTVIDACMRMDPHLPYLRDVLTRNKKRDIAV